MVVYTFLFCACFQPHLSDVIWAALSLKLHTDSYTLKSWTRVEIWYDSNQMYLKLYTFTLQSYTGSSCLTTALFSSVTTIIASPHHMIEMLVFLNWWGIYNCHSPTISICMLYSWFLASKINGEASSKNTSHPHVLLNNLQWPTQKLNGKCHKSMPIMCCFA